MINCERDLFFSNPPQTKSGLLLLFIRKSCAMKKFFGGKDNKTRPRRMSLQVIPDNHEVIHFKDDDMDDNAVMKMIQKQRRRRGSLPGPPPNLGQNSKVGQG